MNMIRAALALAMGCCALVPAARAVPPTVTPSPGYDARLQQSRDARLQEERVRPSTVPPASRPYHRRVHH
jgi:hypothetical protein